MADSKSSLWAPRLPEPHALQHLEKEDVVLPFVFQKEPAHLAAVIPGQDAFPFSVIPKSSVPPPSSASKGYEMVLNKPSLFLLGFGLMLLGVCFFFSGLWLGLWMASPSGTPLSVQASAEPAHRLSNGSNAFLDATAKNQLLNMARQSGGATGQLATLAQIAVKSEQRRSNADFGNAPFGSGHRTVEAGHNSGDEPAAGTHSIQLGAFMAKENALDLIKKLNTRSIMAFLVQGTDAEGFPVFYVRSGTYDSFRAAQATANAINAQKDLSAIVVPLRGNEKRL